MARKKKPGPVSLETLVLERAVATGTDFISFIEQEVSTADSRLRGTFFKSAADQDKAREQRMRLGRLLFWLRNGNLPLGATPQDLDLYRKLAANQPVQPHPFLAEAAAGRDA